MGIEESLLDDMTNAIVRRAGYPGDDAAVWDRGVLGSFLLLPAMASSQEPCQAFALCFPIPS